MYINIILQSRALNRPQNKKPDVYPIEEYKSKPLILFLKEIFKLPEKLCHIIIFNILNDIGIKYDTLTTEEGLNEITRFINSMGIYGSLPYLYTIYGTSDILQGLCRVSAVWGGTFMLKENVINYVLDESKEKVIGIIDNEGRFLKANCIISSPEYVPRSYIKHNEDDDWIYSTYILDRELYSQRSLIIIPPNHSKFNNKYVIRILQISPSLKCSTDNTYIVYLYTKKGDRKNEDCVNELDNVINSLCSVCETTIDVVKEKNAEDGEKKDKDVEKEMKDEEKKEEKETITVYPKILYSVSYINHIINPINELPKNLYIPNINNENYNTLDTDCCFEEAELIFKKAFPDIQYMTKVQRQQESDFDSIPQNIPKDFDKNVNELENEKEPNKEEPNEKEPSKEEPEKE